MKFHITTTKHNQNEWIDARVRRKFEGEIILYKEDIFYTYIDYIIEKFITYMKISIK